MNPVSVRYVGPQDAVDVDVRSVDSDDMRFRRTIAHGEVVEVPYEVAHGTKGEPWINPATGKPEIHPDSGQEVIVGHYGGLLDQADNWQLAEVGSLPTGTVDEVLAWVDDDPSRAAVALTAENDRATPRVTLVEALQALLADTGGQDR